MTEVTSKSSEKLSRWPGNFLGKPQQVLLKLMTPGRVVGPQGPVSCFGKVSSITCDGNSCDCLYCESLDLGPAGGLSVPIQAWSYSLFKETSLSLWHVQIMWFLLMGCFVPFYFWPPTKGSWGSSLHFSSPLNLLKDSSELEFLAINCLRMDLLVSLKLWAKLKSTISILDSLLAFINVVFLPLWIWDWRISMGMGSPDSTSKIHCLVMR